MRKRTKRIIAGAAALAAVPAFALSTAFSASAANDTPDGHTYQEGGGWALWNDYADDDHNVDIDNVGIEDDRGDGKSVKLYVYWKGKTYTKHAYKGREEWLNIGNVPNNSKVYWRLCEWDDGHQYWCSDKHWLKE